jgi:hypothetical protein
MPGPVWRGGGWTWCFADRLDVLEPLQALVGQYLSGLSSVRSGIA